MINRGGNCIMKPSPSKPLGKRSVNVDENCRGVGNGGTLAARKPSSGRVPFNTLRASKVFGNLVDIDVDCESTHSLSYSPSPVAGGTKHACSGGEGDAPIPRAFAFDLDDGDVASEGGYDGGGNSRAHSISTSEEKTTTDDPLVVAAETDRPAEERQDDGRPGSNCAKKRSNRVPVPSKKDRIKQMQEAIDSATVSVNDSLNAGRKAKEEAKLEKRLETARLRAERRAEKEDAEVFQAESIKAKKELMELKNQLSTQYRKAKNDSEQKEQQARRDAIMKESQFKSEVFRAHQKDMKQAEDRRRRRSMEARSKIRANNRTGMERMKLARIEEDHALLEERYMSSLAQKDTKEAEAERRRNSLAFRNQEGKQQRDLLEQRKQEEQMAEHDSIELKWAGERDAEEYKKKLADERRNSLAFRNQEGKRQRELLDQRRQEEQLKEHASLEMKWDGERDAEAYKKALAEERRNSFAFRNQEGGRQRDEAQQRKIEEKAAEHDDYTLKWDGENDAQDYQKQLAKERRDSLAWRNQDGKRQRDVMEQLKSEQQASEHDSIELRLAGERDADEYRKAQAEERRQSLEFRNHDGKRQRDVEEQMRLEDLATAHDSYELKWDGERDAEAYKKALAEERRNSFAFRNQEGLRQRDEAQQRKMEEKTTEHDDYTLKWDGEKDAQDYQKQLAKERRDSFAWRNQDGKRQREVVEHLKSEQQASEHDSIELRLAGERDADEYRKAQAEERRQSLEFRNQDGKRQRDAEEQMRLEDLATAHDSYELKWDGERDAEAYKKALAEERRNSFAFRNQEGLRQRDEAQQRKMEENAADHDDYTLKWDGENDAQDYQKQLAKERRDSLAWRNQDGKRQRDVTEQLKSEQQASEHDSIELRLAGERDADEHRKAQAEERRQSLEYRNLDGKRQRDVAEQMRCEEQAAAHDSYELKWDGERDAEAYKKALDEERRESYAFRNQEGKRQRNAMDQLKLKKQAADHESYELKWAGEKDAEAYEKQLAQERRESFAFRNQEASRRKAVMEELLSINKQKEHESLVLKWAGQDDVKEYLSQQEEERRNSLAFRNEEGRRHREIDQRIHSENVKEAAEEELLQAECQRDVEKYKKECAEKDRTSLQFRQKESRLHRLQAEEDHQQDIEKQHESYELEAEARRDVNEYVKICKKRDRLSLVFRAKEKRRHAEWEKNQAEISREEKSRETRDRAMDSKYIQLAEEKERAQKAIDAIRHASRNFAMNPFASLLDS